MGDQPKVGPNTGNRGKGRPKGSQNKITSDVKRAILEAAEAAGGPGGMVAYLTAQAAINPAAFMTLIGKVLPLTVAGDGESPIRHVIERRIVHSAGD